MVGSGFTRNALKTRPDATEPPTWHEVTKELSIRLYPKDDQKSQRDKTAETSATDGILRLAQEYKTAFGRSELHRLLQQLIRDDDFKPGDTHTRLLKLPWRDVFTTNWDTLLERACGSVIDRAYKTVRKMDEIPLTDRPRIIKLHGSLPAYFPLVITEEDYRTYPSRFAPFVNTAQQAMMETVFLLIGFSGNDPNFLHWSGWVRDNLGTAAPKIYLAGWLKLSPHRRRMLEDRNVVPIDLAQHPKGNLWPEHLCHKFATEWILHTLENGCPYDPTDWPPEQVRQYSQAPELLLPIQELQSVGPQVEPWQSTNIDSDDLPNDVRNTLEIWAHNRKTYPGWLVIPNSARHLLSEHTDSWEPCILRVLDGFQPVDQLHAIYELVWRRETLLDRLSTQLEVAAQDILTMIDCDARTVDGKPNRSIDWVSVRKAWRNVAIALVTNARIRLDRNTFSRWIDALASYIDDDNDTGNRIHHERSLWAIYTLDYESLESLLEGWSTENCDTAWMIRKAALLFDTGRNDEAKELVKDALATIRNIPPDDRSVAGPSREGWAMWAMWREEDWYLICKRWDELAALKCNAQLERYHIINSLQGNGEEKKTPSFDLGTRQVQGQLYSNVDPQAAAYRAIRLSEVAGLPQSTNRMIIASGIFKLAAEELCTSNLKMAVSLVLRACDYDEDKTLKRVLSRTRVATLPANSARELAEICESIINYSLPKMAGATSKKVGVFWAERMRVAMEVLSRLVLRLVPDKVEAIFNKALEYYKNEHVTRKTLLVNSVRSLLRRSWESLPEVYKSSHVLDLLNAPIVGLDNFTSAVNLYPEPSENLYDFPKPAAPRRTSKNKHRWEEAVRLIVCGLSGDVKARERASRRLLPVVFWDRITKGESKQVATALWKHSSPDDLPCKTLLFDWTFLLLPEPKPGLAEQRFRHKWFTTSIVPQEGVVSPDDILWQIGNAMSSLKDYQRSLELSDGDRSYLIKIVNQWSESKVPSHFDSFYESHLQEPTRRALTGLPTILAEIQIPDTIGKKLYEKIQKLNESGIPGFELIPGLVKTMPDQYEELASTMRVGLVSDTLDLAERAVVGLHHWLISSANVTSEVRLPPDELVREIGLMVAVRKKTALSQALAVAKWIFDEGSDVQKSTIHDLTLQGLGYLLEELRYDRERDPNDDTDVPLLRLRCVQLALSMAKHGSEYAPAVSRWLKIAKEDPLPEVRFL